MSSIANIFCATATLGLRVVCTVAMWKGFTPAWMKRLGDLCMGLCCIAAVLFATAFLLYISQSAILSLLSFVRLCFSNTELVTCLGPIGLFLAERWMRHLEETLGESSKQA
jgi:hypothetical protein